MMVTLRSSYLARAKSDVYSYLALAVNNPLVRFDHIILRGCRLNLERYTSARRHVLQQQLRHIVIRNRVGLE